MCCAEGHGEIAGRRLCRLHLLIAVGAMQRFGYCQCNWVVRASEVSCTLTGVSEEIKAHFLIHDFRSVGFICTCNVCRYRLRLNL